MLPNTSRRASSPDLQRGCCLHNYFRITHSSFSWSAFSSENITIDSLWIAQTLYRVSHQFFDQTLRPIYERTSEDRMANFFSRKGMTLGHKCYFIRTRWKRCFQHVTSPWMAATQNGKSKNLEKSHFCHSKRSCSGIHINSQRKVSFCSRTLKCWERSLLHWN